MYRYKITFEYNPFYLDTIHLSIARIPASKAWGSTYIANLKKLSSQQKLVKLNILNAATFTYKVNQKTAPNYFSFRVLKTVSFLSY